MVESSIGYKLGRWSNRYFLEKGSKLRNFYCFKCRKVVMGVTLLDHLETCNPVFLRRLRKWGWKEEGRVKQKRSSRVGTTGDGPSSQQAVLLPFPGEDTEIEPEDL